MEGPVSWSVRIEHCCCIDIRIETLLLCACQTHELDDEEDDDENTVASIAAALRKEGIPVSPRTRTRGQQSTNDEVPSDSVKAEGLLDKVTLPYLYSVTLVD